MDKLNKIIPAVQSQAGNGTGMEASIQDLYTRIRNIASQRWTVLLKSASMSCSFTSLPKKLADVLSKT